MIIKLPKPMLKGNMSVEETMATRRSVREYSATDTVLTLDEVSQLLWAAYGVTDSLIKKSKIPDSIRIKNKIPDSVKYKIRKFFLKTAPSAGGLYPLEIYLVAGNVKGLAPGVYKYRPLGHYLLLIQTGDKRKELCTASYDQQMVGKAPISLVYSAVFSRNTKKYEQRGRERYVCMDLGHSGENVYLQATALKMGTCAIGSFEDSDVSKVINMPKEEEPLYIMPVGRR
ncbi:MAG: SagB/ThcOx family dehydrogenase [Bacteroidetes bacterium]|nr:SagB/ThcOx family dehydrogenase [Bacteroidota bacterium]